MALTPMSIDGQTHPIHMNGDVASDDKREIASLWTRYEDLKMMDATKNVLLEDLLSRYEYLKLKHADYVKEHSNPGEKLAGAGAREQILEANVKQLQRILNRDAFILVLIDGDGMIFNDNFLRAGEAGGERAAVTLLHSVLQWAASNVIDCPKDTKIVVRVYGHLRDLAALLTTTNDIDSATLVEDFFRGFTNGQPLFDFVDIVHNRYGTDVKIFEQFKLHVYDYQCRHILLGISCLNDNYASILQPYTNVEVVKRVTLLESMPLVQNDTFQPFSKQSFPAVFRNSTLLVGSTYQFRMRPTISSDVARGHTPLNGASEIFSPSASTAYSPRCSPKTINLPNEKSFIAAAPGSHLRTDSFASNGTASSEANKNSWATVTRARASLPLTDEVPKAISPVFPGFPNSISRNRRGQRIDPPLEYDRESVQALKKMKLCNQFFIGGGCCHHAAGKADKCPHRHDITLSNTDKHCLRVVARETPCKRGTHCEDLKCIYGHKCPFPEAMEGSLRGTCMNGDLCRFPREMHGVDTTKFTKVSGI